MESHYTRHRSIIPSSIILFGSRGGGHPTTSAQGAAGVMELYQEMKNQLAQDTLRGNANAEGVTDPSFKPSWSAYLKVDPSRHVPPPR